ncbi:unnamed protein product [Lactuca saligna]|uniref:Glutaredoxin domain-containing protein n=1 Tax=Lactuca saligna TaxID=75948 RepID=A0AA35ZG78_LACSI|nr:unnamed protein product [Lactuca saligna]
MKHEGGVDFSDGSSLQLGLWGLRRVATIKEVLRQGKETNGMTVIKRVVKGYQDNTTTILGVFDSGCSVEIGGDSEQTSGRRRRETSTTFQERRSKAGSVGCTTFPSFVDSPILSLKMAKALSKMVLNGIVSFKSSRATSMASGSLYHYGMGFSTTAPNDPDTHDDFKPTNKLENSGVTLKDIVEQDVKNNPVMVYMKGDPNRPLCGFSSLAVKILQEYRVPISSRNILEDSELKSAVKAFSTWPTFPQIFINGEFSGGSDIILDMHKKGELEEKLKVAVASKQ